ncbi:protease PrsW [Paractinoplanes abujensis]|uniref:RsiW-degrading membrane proteinase PrsW (M82 family) n=1 Tax=Paractinoplanes abujensis TaxID=882441 RepID=A0A7W7D1Y5_9ACTN|nr:PrsW family intramembrane metalloprotease [Actinoplanes abujensis]MBB4697805.1 RsiW-degrading membrane proteinase PrsW (M82 family) [Actinoplanes abujensis]GID19709.1 protease PrsW [Actinoplanes abujensis]
MREHNPRRWAWLGVLVIGLALYAVVLRTLVHTQNPNFVPALILLGATVVPLSFLTFAQARTGRWQVPASALVIAAFFGGVIGIVVAGTLEYDTLHRLGVLPMVLVAVIEESAKLIVPLILLFTILSRHERRLPSDGLIIGVASGMGFAALETMGYGFTALLASGGNVGSVEQTLFVRGLTAPAGHTAWTGLTAGALWALIAAPNTRRVLAFLATFAGAVVLHTCWDTFSTPIAYVVLAVISLGWLFLALRHYRTFAEHAEGTVLRPLTI